jgi:rod shape-determining protein MreB
LGIFDVGIDLGTSNTRIYSKSKGMLLDQPSVVAMESFSNKLMAVGEEARQMLGRTPDTVTAIRPLGDGVIANFDRTSVMLASFVNQIKRPFTPIRAVVTVPFGSTAVERRAVEDAVLSSKIKKIHLLEDPLAAAIGLNLPIFEPSGHMIVDIGGGKTEVSVVSLGGIVAETTCHSCGIQMDKDIVAYVRKTYNILIGDQIAEEIKIRLGAAVERETVDFMTVSGRDLIDGLPLNLTISSDEVYIALKDSLEGIVDAIKATLERVDPELAADIIQNGIILIGGGSQLPGWSEYIYKETGVSTEVAVNALDCIAIGAGRAANMLDKLKKASTIE